jgi:hypothetical protein
MKLLVSWMTELRGYVTREYYYVMQHLMSEHSWQQIRPSDLAEHADRAGEWLQAVFGELPTVVIFWETWELIHSVYSHLRSAGCRTVFFADDLQTWPDSEVSRDAKLRTLSLCDAVLATYAYVFDVFYPELQDKPVAWVPHSASPDFSLSFNDRPENAVLLSGCLGEIYPLRMRMKDLSKRMSSVVHNQHPGYGEFYDYETDSRVGSGYAGLIGRFKAAFTDASNFRYIVAKYFEIPSTGSLLVADEAVCEPLRDLGFFENMHYVPVNLDNLEERIEFVLNPAHSIEIDAIRRRGQELVKTAHTTRHRAALIDQACCGNFSSAAFNSFQPVAAGRA